MTQLMPTLCSHLSYFRSFLIYHFSDPFSDHPIMGFEMDMRGRHLSRTLNHLENRGALMDLLILLGFRREELRYDRDKHIELKKDFINNFGSSGHHLYSQNPNFDVVSSFCLFFLLELRFFEFKFSVSFSIQPIQSRISTRRLILPGDAGNIREGVSIRYQFCSAYHRMGCSSFRHDFK